MIRTVLFFTYFTLYLIATLPKMLYIKYLQKHGKVEKSEKLIFKTTKRWATCMVRGSSSKINVIGEENVPKEGAVLFVSNHQSDYDIPLLMSCINKPKGFIAKIETLKIPVIRTWMTFIKCIFMDRKDMRQSVRCINEGIEILKSGHSMVIFPEGTRSKGGPMKEFKPGSFRLATKSEVPIVPITINGSYKMFEERGYKITPANVEIVISEPIPTKGLTKEEQVELTSKVFNIISSKL